MALHLLVSLSSYAVLSHSNSTFSARDWPRHCWKRECTSSWHQPTTFTCSCPQRGCQVCDSSTTAREVSDKSVYEPFRFYQASSFSRNCFDDGSIWGGLRDLFPRSCLQASLSTLFLDIYKISGLVSGLIYIPFGVACALSAFATGRLLDRNFRKTATEQDVAVTRNKADNLSTFPIERARLRTVMPLVFASACLTIAYGWQLQAGVVMAGPLVTQFFIGLTIQTMFTALSTLLVDVNQECPSTAQAACNLVRCEMAAGYLAALDPLLRATGPGWTFLILAAILLLSSVVLLVLQWKGLHWRQARLNSRTLRGTSGSLVAPDDEQWVEHPGAGNDSINVQNGRRGNDHEAQSVSDVRHWSYQSAFNIEVQPEPSRPSCNRCAG